MGRVSGKVIVVTGGGRGLGEAMVRLLVREGGKVVYTDIQEEAKALGDELGADALFVRQDVRLEADWRRVIAAAEETFGPVSVLVNNAGLQSPPKSFITEIDEEAYRRIVEVNQFGTFLGMRLIVDSMKKAKGGSIVNLSSLSGLLGKPNSIAYTASKFAVRGMTKVAAVEFGPLNIRVNSIHPGPIRTRMIYEADGTTLRPTIVKMMESLPVGRLGEPEEIAQMVLLLASDEMAFATGAEFVIDGGASCG